MSIELIEIAMAVMFVAVWLLAVDITCRRAPAEEQDATSSPRHLEPDNGTLHLRERLRGTHTLRGKSARKNLPK